MKSEETSGASVQGKKNRALLTLETVEQGLRFRVQAGSGKESVIDSGPGMVAPSPVEMLLVALGGCGGMDVISILRKQRQRITAYEVAVSGERLPEHPTRFRRIEVLHRVTGHQLNPNAIAEAIRLSDTKYCSVHAAFRSEIEIVSRFEIVPA